MKELKTEEPFKEKFNCLHILYINSDHVFSGWFVHDSIAPDTD